MQNSISHSPHVFIVAYVNEYGEVVGFPMGGGSSTKSSIKAHPTYDSAKRSSRHFPNTKVVKTTEFEIMD